MHATHFPGQMAILETQYMSVYVYMARMHLALKYYEHLTHHESLFNMVWLFKLPNLASFQ